MSLKSMVALNFIVVCHVGLFSTYNLPINGITTSENLDGKLANLQNRSKISFEPAVVGAFFSFFKEITYIKALAPHYVRQLPAAIGWLARRVAVKT